MRRTAGIKNNIGTRVERREKPSNSLPPYLHVAAPRLVQVARTATGSPVGHTRQISMHLALFSSFCSSHISALHRGTLQETNQRSITSPAGGAPECAVPASLTSGPVQQWVSSYWIV